MNTNPMMDRKDGHRAFNEGEGFRGGPRGGFRRGNRDAEGFGPRCMPRASHDEGFAPHNMPRTPHDEGFGPHGMPRGGRGPGSGGPGGPGFPRHGGPGGFGGPGGMPPRRPDPEFLKRRIEDGDLMELIDMAGRMAQRLPQGGPARGQALILSILAGRDALSQRELQQILGIQPGSLSELLSKLEAKGCLTREKAEDRRGNLLRITDAGREALPEADGESDDPLSPLTGDQQDQLAGLLRTLLAAWVDRMELAFPRGHRPAQRPVEL